MQIDSVQQYRPYNSGITNIDVNHTKTKMVRELEDTQKPKELDKSQEAENKPEQQPDQEIPEIDMKDKTSFSPDAQDISKDNKVEDVKKIVDEIKAGEGQVKPAGGVPSGGEAGGVGNAGQIQGIQAGQSSGKVSEIASSNLVNHMDNIKQGVKQADGVGSLDSKVSALKENLHGQNASKVNDMDEKVNALKESLHKYGSKKVKEGTEPEEKHEVNQDKNKPQEPDKTKEIEKSREKDKSEVKKTGENSQVNQGGGSEEIKADQTDKADETDPQKEQKKLEIMSMECVKLQAVTQIDKAAEKAGIDINQVNQNNINTISDIARKDIQELLKPDEFYKIPEHNERIGQKVENGVRQKLEQFIGGGSSDQLKNAGMGQG